MVKSIARDFVKERRYNKIHTEDVQNCRTSRTQSFFIYFWSANSIQHCVFIVSASFILRAIVVIVQHPSASPVQHLKDSVMLANIDKMAFSLSVCSSQSALWNDSLSINYLRNVRLLTGKRCASDDTHELTNGWLCERECNAHSVMDCVEPRSCDPFSNFNTETRKDSIVSISFCSFIVIAWGWKDDSSIVGFISITLKREEMTINWVPVFWPILE